MSYAESSSIRYKHEINQLRFNNEKERTSPNSSLNNDLGIPGFQNNMSFEKDKE